MARSWWLRKSVQTTGTEPLNDARTMPRTSAGCSGLSLALILTCPNLNCVLQPPLAKRSEAKRAHLHEEPLDGECRAVRSRTLENAPDCVELLTGVGVGSTHASGPAVGSS